MHKYVRILVAAILFIPACLYAAAETPANSLLWHGFESANYWTASDWTNNAFSNPIITGDYVTEGKKSLQITFDMKKPGQQGVIQLLEVGDMSGVNEVSFDIYNSSMTVMTVYLMLKTGQNWVYHESKRLAIQPGWNKGVKFGLKAKEFGSGGVYNLPIKEPESVRRFGLIFEAPVAAQGLVFLDNIQISGTGIEKLIPVQAETGKDSGTEVLIDSFESERIKWTAGGGSCATSCEYTTLESSIGKSAMKANFNVTEPGTNAQFLLEDTVDLTDATEMKVDIFYPDDFPSNITIALTTGDKWVWQEYTTTKLIKGWNRDITFYFKDKRWKNEKSNWNNNVNPDEMNNVRKIGLVLFPANMGPGYVIFDNVRIKTKNPAKLEAIMPFDMSALAFYTWNSFEKGVNWQTSSGESGATAVRPASGFGSGQDKGMELVFSTQNNVDKAMYVYKSKLDFSGSCGIKFSVYNPMTATVQMSMAYQTGDSETWIETKTIGIGPGWNRDIFFDYTAPSMKSAVSNWNYTDYFDKRNDIRDIIVQIYPNQKMSGSVYVTDFMLARHNFMGDIGKTAGFIFSNNSNATFEAVKYNVWDEGKAEGTFESSAALTAWKGANMTGWGAAEVELSGKYASQGKQSMKISYKNGFNGGDLKSGAQTVPPADLSPYSRLAFDVYNPGRIQKLTVAFQSDNLVPEIKDGWFETNTSITLKPGWNKNISIDLNSADWQMTVGGVMASPVAIVPIAKTHMISMLLVFHGGYEGSLYVDNLRWGQKSQVGITDGEVVQDVSLVISPDKAVEAKVNLKAAYYHGQNTGLAVDSAHLILRGFGNELSLFSGEPVKVMDDVFGIMDPNTLGSNLLGVSLAGTVYPINTSYMFSCISLNNSDMWKLGTTYVGTARVKTFFLDKNFVGLIYMNEKRGFDEGANFITADYEQGTSVYGADTSLSIPVLNLALVNLKAEGLMTAYDAMNPMYMLVPDPVNPIFSGQNIPAGSRKMFWLGELDIRAGYLQVYAMYRQIDPYFAAYYFNPDYSPGHTEKDAKVTYTIDDLPPFSYIKLLSPDFAAFVRNTQLMCEYDQTDSAIDTYSKNSVTLDLKNDESLAFSNYHFWFMYINEGNDTKIPTLSITGLTKLLIQNKLTIKLLGRYSNTRTYYYGGQIQSTLQNLGTLEGYAEASLQLTRELKLTGSYKAMSLSDKTSHGNWYAELDASLLGSLNLVLSYGGIPFDGYWYSDSSPGTGYRKTGTYNDTQTIYSVSLKGRY